MKVALIGLPNAGRTTIFNAVTGQKLETPIYSTPSEAPHPGIVKVPDSRVEKLSEVYAPRKAAYATIEYLDVPGIARGDAKHNRKIFDLIKDADAIVHVVRAFQDPAVVHPLGSTDPIRDIEALELELIFGDLELIEKRLERIEEGKKRGKKPDEAERKLLFKCRDSLMQEIPLRKVGFTVEELKSMRALQFLSTVPEVILLNVVEEYLQDDASAERLSELAGRFTMPLLMLCGKIEMEISQLPREDITQFLDELGIAEPASQKLIHTCYRVLGLISFLTIGDDEVRAWPIRKGTHALQAAGKVHSDIERGFIRAEVISFDEFIAAGSMHAARDQGRLRLEGKSYEVKDGDIIHFRFNV